MAYNEEKLKKEFRDQKVKVERIKKVNSVETPLPTPNSHI